MSGFSVWLDDAAEFRYPKRMLSKVFYLIRSIDQHLVAQHSMVAALCQNGFRAAEATSVTMRFEEFFGGADWKDVDGG